MRSNLSLVCGVAISSPAKESFSISSCINRRSMFSNSVGLEVISIFNCAAASSTKSIALSGKNRSAIYLADNVAAATKAESEILTLWCTS